MSKYIEIDYNDLVEFLKEQKVEKENGYLDSTLLDCIDEAIAHLAAESGSNGCRANFPNIGEEIEIAGVTIEEDKIIACTPDTEESPEKQYILGQEDLEELWSIADAHPSGFFGGKVYRGFKELILDYRHRRRLKDRAEQSRRLREDEAQERRLLAKLSKNDLVKRSK